MAMEATTLEFFKPHARNAVWGMLTYVVPAGVLMYLVKTQRVSATYCIVRRSLTTSFVELFLCTLCSYYTLCLSLTHPIVHIKDNSIAISLVILI